MNELKNVAAPKYVCNKSFLWAQHVMAQQYVVRGEQIVLFIVFPTQPELRAQKACDHHHVKLIC